MVGKLPFEPFSLLAKLAHRGLESPAANDCSVVSDCAPTNQGRSALKEREQLQYCLCCSNRSHLHAVFGQRITVEAA